jgi:DNA primase
VPGYLTEGFFDVMRLQQQGVNAFAIMGSYLSAVQVDKITQMFSRIILVPDGDKPGAEAASRIGTMLSGRIPVSVFSMEDGKDPDELTEDELARLKIL